MKRTRVTMRYIHKQLKTNILILVVLFILIPSFALKAQTFEAGIFAGAAYYLGDLNPQNHFVESNIAYGGLLKYNINQRFSLGLTATQATIKSDATNYNIEHGTFKPSLSAQINEFAFLGEVNFFPYEIDNRNNSWTPYLFGGAAYFLSDNSNSFSLPFGLGIKLTPFEKVGLNLFWGARKTFTDKLDNIESIGYKGYNYDWYIFYGLNITFAFRLKKDNGCRI